MQFFILWFTVKCLLWGIINLLWRKLINRFLNFKFRITWNMSSMKLIEDNFKEVVVNIYITQDYILINVICHLREQYCILVVNNYINLCNVCLLLTNYFVYTLTAKTNASLNQLCLISWLTACLWELTKFARFMKLRNTLKLQKAFIYW